MRQKGFTLLEIIVALCILSIFSVIALQGIHTIINNRDQIDQHLDQINQMQIASVLMKRDIAQMVDRATGTGDTSNGTSIQASSSSLSFTRLGYNNPLGLEPRTTMETVAYNLQNGLTRSTSSLLNSTSGSATEVRVLLPGIKKLNFQYIDAKGQLHDSWPPAQNSNANSDDSNDNSDNSSASTSGSSSTTQAPKWPDFPSGVQVTLSYGKNDDIVWIIPVQAARLRPQSN